MNESYEGVEWWLIRHGLTGWNLQRKYQGHSDEELLPGEASGLTPLRSKLAGQSFAGVYCSDLKRCRQTLQLIRPDLTAQAVYDPRLKEMNFGAWEGKTYEMLEHNPLYRAWIDNPKLYTPPEGESWELFQNRVADFQRELVQKSKELAVSGNANPSILLVVTHGGVISTLNMLMNPDADFWDSKVSPGEIMKLKLS
ncbi:histidine phosphatase family protein [Paenibacillus lutimineralis]|uniref:Histidine phosphatase family protein n=1 Tax=Paenibacillus lutimineralis TaxID=2707005 RepID=A0A3S9V2K3_9BACL|nr:histidine phosphatase family protein [Paenibacillus lutimineralis]AZS16784.1 histidine phosphatase family protein [Paenibacillus lutimineralis]